MKPTPSRNDLRAQLRDYLNGFAQGESGRLQPLEQRPWRLAIELEQLRRSHGFLSVLDDALLAALAAGTISLDAELKRVVYELEARRSPVHAAGGVPHSEGPPEAILAMREETARIAREVLGIQTLEAQNMDRLDFHEVAVWSLREALGQAFIAGWHAAA